MNNNEICMQKTFNTATAVEYIKKHSKDYKLFKKVPELPLQQYIKGDKLVAIIDLETMGLECTKHKIIEIGIIVLSVSDTRQFKAVHQVYSSLQDPCTAIPHFITNLTGITNGKVQGHKIDWDRVLDLIETVDAVICHNASFDRKFLINQTPSLVSDVFKTKRFACTKQGIAWAEQGYQNTKLDYLNFVNEYFYDAHRAINDCWATLNIVRQTGSFPELLNTTKREVFDEKS